MNYTAYLGAIGWDHAAWRDDFYPEDMPEDWWLAFYNTQFRCVYLERATWADLAPDIWAQWAQETQESFRFILATSGSKATDAAAAEAFGGRAVLVESSQDPRLLWFDAASELKSLAGRMRGWAGEEPLYLISRDAAMPRMTEMRTVLELMGL